MNAAWLFACIVLVAYLQGGSCDQAGKCKQHSECPENTACDAESSQCVDPCLKHPKCGSEAACIIDDHLAKCICNPGSIGNPYKSCSSSAYDLLTQGLADVPQPPPPPPPPARQLKSN